MSGALNAELLNPAITCNDLQRSVKFYTDGLGFEIVHRYEIEGRLQYVAMMAGSVKLGIGQDDFKKGRDRAKGVGLRIWIKTQQDLQAIADRIKGAGFAVDEGPVATQWGSTTINLTDPDGFKISVEKPAPAAA